MEALPDLAGRPTVVFCTCEVSPRATLSTLSDWLEARGADVRGRVVFKRKKSLANAPRSPRASSRSFPPTLTGRAPRARVGG